MSEPETAASEGERFSALLSFIVATVPEVHDWWMSSLYGDEFDKPLTLGTAHALAWQHLFDDNDVPIDNDQVWPRLLQVAEIALAIEDLLTDNERPDDATTVNGFAEAGIICDITQTVVGLERLLPWMGPLSVDAARGEVALHSTSRGFAHDDVDWANAGTEFQPLDVLAPSLLPTRG